MDRKASEIIDILTEDHDRLLVLFAAFERLRPGASDDALQTLVEIGSEKNTTVVFPLPIDIFSSLGRALNNLGQLGSTKTEG